jgi:CubicO group peptidase (beta-lactamase class C family)
MPVNSEKAMINFLQKKSLEFSPGTDWKYCNTGYFPLGFIIQKINRTVV